MAPRKKAATGLAKKANTSIANIQQQLAQEAAGIDSQVGSASTNTISLRDKVFTMPNGEVVTGPIQLVIIDFVSMNKFYEGKYNPSNPTPPECFAINKIPTELAPDESSPEVQSEGDCSECPMAVWGSDGDGKACKETRRLAVLPVDATDKDQVMTLNVPPTAVKGFDAYVKQVAKLYQVPPVGVLTTIDFHPEKDYPLPLFGNAEANPDVELFFARRDEAQDVLSVKPDYSGQAAEPAKPKRRAPAKKKARRA